MLSELRAGDARQAPGVELGLLVIVSRGAGEGS